MLETVLARLVASGLGHIKVQCFCRDALGQIALLLCVIAFSHGTEAHSNLQAPDTPPGLGSIRTGGSEGVHPPGGRAVPDPGSPSTPGAEEASSIVWEPVSMDLGPADPYHNLCEPLPHPPRTIELPRKAHAVDSVPDPDPARARSGNSASVSGAVNGGGGTRAGAGIADAGVAASGLGTDGSGSGLGREASGGSRVRAGSNCGGFAALDRAALADSGDHMETWLSSAGAPDNPSEAVLAGSQYPGTNPSNHEAGECNWGGIGGGDGGCGQGEATEPCDGRGPDGSSLHPSVQPDRHPGGTGEAKRGWAGGGVAGSGAFSISPQGGTPASSPVTSPLGSPVGDPKQNPSSLATSPLGSPVGSLGPPALLPLKPEPAERAPDAVSPAGSPSRALQAPAPALEAFDMFAQQARPARLALMSAWWQARVL